MAIPVSEVVRVIIAQFLLYEDSLYISEVVRSNVCPLLFTAAQLHSSSSFPTHLLF